MRRLQEHTCHSKPSSARDIRLLICRHRLDVSTNFPAKHRREQRVSRSDSVSFQSPQYWRVALSHALNSLAVASGSRPSIRPGHIREADPSKEDLRAQENEHCAQGHHARCALPCPLAGGDAKSSTDVPLGSTTHILWNTRRRIVQRAPLWLSASAE